MRRNQQDHKDPAGVTDFLSATLPFSELPSDVMEKAARSCSVDFFPKGEMLFTQDETIADSLLLIQRGGVRNFVRDEHGAETLVDLRGEGSSLGEMSIIENKPSTMNTQAVEDTFVIRMPREVFMETLETRACVAQFYLKNFSENYLSKAFMEMRQRRTVVTTESGLYLFRAHVGELAAKKPVVIPFGRSIQQAAGEMTKFNVGSLLIQEPSGGMAGIVTDTDLRKAVALGLDYATPAETIMSTPVATIEEHEVCFDALLKMMERHIHHLAVTRNGQVTGMITSHDIMVKQGKSPLAIFREIMGRQEIEELYPVSSMVPEVVRTLVQEGAKAGNITRLITVLNDMILERVLTMLIKKLGPPPVPFCWLLMGSEGRKEQTFATDQDNALVYNDSEHEAIQRAAHIYFTAFAEQAIGHLVACGFPPCQGGIMANNPKWLMPLSRWKQTFADWISVPEPMQVLHSTIFFDFGPGSARRSLPPSFGRR